MTSSGTDAALNKATGGKDVLDDSDASIKTKFQYEGVIDLLGAAITNQEKLLTTRMTDLQKNNNPSPAALAGLQYEINKWSLTFNMFSSMIKAIKDVSAGIVQKV